MTLAGLYRQYAQAGFPPDGFWVLTPRLLMLQLQAAADRLRHEMDARNRTAWSIAAMSGAAHAGKLRPFREYFGVSASPAKGAQTAAQMETALHALAAAWGANPPPAMAGQE